MVFDGWVDTTRWDVSTHPHAEGIRVGMRIEDESCSENLEVILVPRADINVQVSIRNAKGEHRYEDVDLIGLSIVGRNGIDSFRESIEIMNQFLKKLAQTLDACPESNQEIPDRSTTTE